MPEFLELSLYYESIVKPSSPSTYNISQFKSKTDKKQKKSKFNMNKTVRE